MALRRPKIKLTTILTFAAGAVLVAGAAVLAQAPHRAAEVANATRATPAATSAVTPAPVVAPAATSQPAVAGAATQAPSASSAPVAKLAAQPAAPAATPAPTLAADTITLTLIDPDGTFHYTVRLLPGTDACSVLIQAKNEGKISFVDIDYSYLATLHSAYVRQINSYANNWTVKLNGVSPKGCSLVSPQPNDNVTWRYQ
ncbi:MAG TPA: hypothetical protein VMT30_05525 [Candidatus Saccharimonadia bacterium]|nr:hypothetical protein [Candidatus Saccharimonadia bacterium]